MVGGENGRSGRPAPAAVPAGIVCCLVLLGILAAVPSVSLAEQGPDEAVPRSSVSDQPVPGVVRAPVQPELYEGYRISLVFYDLLGGTDSTANDRALRRQIENKAEPLATGTFTKLFADRAISEIHSLEGIQSASYTLYESEQPGAVVLVVSATLGPEKEPLPRGLISTGRVSELPVLIEDERKLLQLRLNGGLGAYLEHNPWFASPEVYTALSPIALDPPGPGTTTWAEAWVEYGISGAAQLGNTTLYAFGEASLLTSGTIGQDLFRSDARTRTLPEKAYGGFLWAQTDSQSAARLSVGRQDWQLNTGFLFSRFSAGANAGPNASLFLNPRTAYQMAILAKYKRAGFSAEFFDVDPAELRDFDSQTRFQGLNVAWLDGDAWDLGATAYRVPESQVEFLTPQERVVPRKGQSTLAIRVGHGTVIGINGLAALGEYARQGNEEADVEAHAWYAQLGYTARDLMWSPSLTYRYASFSGDDPYTEAREAFDAPLSGGLDEWVQGIIFRKVVTNTNVNSHRVRLNWVPSERVSYTFDYFRLLTDEPTPVGSGAYGDEIDFAARWSISDHLFFLGVAGLAWPDQVIRAQTEDTARRWATLQASLFWNL